MEIVDNRLLIRTKQNIEVGDIIYVKQVSKYFLVGQIYSNSSSCCLIDLSNGITIIHSNCLEDVEKFDCEIIPQKRVKLQIKIKRSSYDNRQYKT